MMKLALFALVAATIMVCICAEDKCRPTCSPPSLYPATYDDTDIEKIFKNDELRHEYYHCFTGDGPCVTDDAKFFKTNIVEAFVTKCSKCTEKQKQSFDLAVDWYTRNAPAEWDYLVKKLLEEETKKNKH